MSPEQTVSFAEMERMMKVQEVILKAMAGSLKWWEAAEIIGVSDRTMRRWRERRAEPLFQRRAINFQNACKYHKPISECIPS